MSDYLLRMIRREDRRRMTARCTVVRGTYPDLETVHADLPCLVRPTLRASTEVTSGGDELGLHRYDVLVPYDSDLRRGDVLTITKSRDPQMVGRWITVREATIDEELTSRRVVAEESVG